ncbi:putative serine/threonine-protein kinase iks1 [Actinomortierella wolfii]|nr:putative serine/threonine-protein kinase iks1 [Actinomortierella wolfii]
MEESDRPICALCRRPLDPDTTVDEEDTSLSATSFMDSNYFRLLSEANQALSRRSTLQAPLRPPSATNTPTSSSRTSLDLDGATESDINPTSPQSRGDPAPLSHDALNQGYYERFFVEQVKLGKGYRGSVFLCQHILDGVFLGEYAIKKVAIGDNHDWLVQMLREVHLLERLHHPNIVSYKHAWLENHRLTKFGPEVACLFILMECANGGNLEEYIESLPEREYAAREASQGGQSSSSIDNTVRSESGMAEAKKPLSARERILQERRKQAAAAAAGASSPPSDNTAPKSNSKLQYLPITEVWSFFFDICEGLAHLHRLGIIHRDLKPPNLLLSYSDTRIKGSKGERPRVLISDFGECEVLDQAAKRDRTGATGTLEFLAPELLQVDEHGRYMNEFSFKGDMWSLGMILYYLCYSRLPYSQIDDVDLLKEEIRSFRSITLPEDESPDRIVPEELKILIRMLLSTDKSKRPSCDEILMTLTPQRERMARGGMNGSNPESSSAASKSTATSTNTATTDLHLFSTSGAISAPSSSSLGVSTIVRRRSRSGHRGQNAQDHLHHPQQQHVGTSISKTSGIRAPSKRVKPLGLGLRHMLRRRMMHYPSAESLYHATELSGARGRLSHFSERHPLQGPSQPYQSAPVRSTLGDTVISSVSPDERTEQQQDWNLKLATQASPAAGPSSRRTELQQQIRPNLMEDSNGPLRRSRRRRSQNSLEERDRSGEPTRGARIDNSKRQQDGSPPRSVRVAEKNAEDTGDGDAISVPPYSPSSPLSSSYWSALADNHSRHRGRGHSIKAIGEKQKRAYQPVSQSGTLADSEASEDSDEKSWKTDIPSLGVEGSSTLRHRRRHTASDVSDPDCVTEADRPSTLKATNNEELERGAADSGDGEVEDPQEGPSQALEKHSSFASSVDNFSEDTYPRQGHSWQSPLSAMMMFASLLARVWFSQRLCYPITLFHIPCIASSSMTSQAQPATAAGSREHSANGADSSMPSTSTPATQEISSSSSQHTKHNHHNNNERQKATETSLQQQSVVESSSTTASMDKSKASDPQSKSPSQEEQQQLQTSSQHDMEQDDQQWPQAHQQQGLKQGCSDAAAASAVDPSSPRGQKRQFEDAGLDEASSSSSSSTSDPGRTSGHVDKRAAVNVDKSEQQQRAEDDSSSQAHFTSPSSSSASRQQPSPDSLNRSLAVQIAPATPPSTTSAAAATSRTSSRPESPIPPRSSLLRRSYHRNLESKNDGQQTNAQNNGQPAQEHQQQINHQQQQQPYAQQQPPKKRRPEQTAQTSLTTLMVEPTTSSTTTTSSPSSSSPTAMAIPSPGAANQTGELLGIKSQLQALRAELSGHRELTKEYLGMLNSLKAEMRTSLEVVNQVSSRLNTIENHFGALKMDLTSNFREHFIGLWDFYRLQDELLMQSLKIRIDHADAFRALLVKQPITPSLGSAVSAGIATANSPSSEPASSPSSSGSAAASGAAPSGGGGRGGARKNSTAAKARAAAAAAAAAAASAAAANAREVKVEDIVEEESTGAEVAHASQQEEDQTITIGADVNGAGAHDQEARGDNTAPVTVVGTGRRGGKGRQVTRTPIQPRGPRGGASVTRHQQQAQQQHQQQIEQQEMRHQQQQMERHQRRQHLESQRQHTPQEAQDSRAYNLKNLTDWMDAMLAYAKAKAAARGEKPLAKPYESWPRDVRVYLIPRDQQTLENVWQEFFYGTKEQPYPLWQLETWYGMEWRQGDKKDTVFWFKKDVINAILIEFPPTGEISDEIEKQALAAVQVKVDKMITLSRFYYSLPKGPKKRYPPPYPKAAALRQITSE